MRRFGSTLKSACGKAAVSSTARPECKIRPIVLEDRKQWQKLWDGYLKFYEKELSQEITNSTWKRMLDPSEKHLNAIVAEIKVDNISGGSTELVGFATYVLHLSTWSITPYCYLEDLFVSKNARGLGVGRKLIEELYRTADKEKWGRVYWATTESNYRARSLYDKLANKTDFIQYRRTT
ncbi:hypothetical protein AAMO2058_000475100 [Amorphochlora amoebiformis]